MRHFACAAVLQLLLAIFTLSTSSGAKLEAEGSKSFSELSKTDFESLAEKTNLYVRALNAVTTVRNSYNRYASWVDLKKGPTGKERYITYGLYEINSSSLGDMVAAATKGPALTPPLRELDDAAVKLAGAAKTLAPLVKAADDYYDQEDFKDDAAKRGQELHQEMMPLFEQIFAAEAALRSGLDTVKDEVDRRQLAEIEKQSGKNYEWHLRNFMISAKSLVDLMPTSAEAPKIETSAYKARYAELESAYNGFMQLNGDPATKKPIMASFVETAIKDYFAASKFLRRTLESPKPDKGEYVTNVNELVEKYNTLIERSNTMR
jgi:hypothetical protein